MLMKKFVKSRWFVSVILLVVVSLACGSIPSIPGIPTFPPKPGTSNVPTGSSPMSGDWNADTKFGHLAFTIDPNGNNVVTAVIDVSSFTCGGTFLTTDTQVLNSWSISDGEFSGDVDLGDNGFLSMNIDGTYDQARKTFAGTWEEDAHGTTCSGQWEAIPRK
jgi:hypothetical protein